MSVDLLVCPCGMRLRIPGAVPGRVGKCPRCGSLLKVPEVVEPAPLEEPDDRPTFVDRRVRKTAKKLSAPSQSGGLVPTPRELETHWHESLLYPLRGDAGVALLAFLPVGLWFMTVPMFALVPGFQSGTALSLIALIFLIPVGLALGYMGGNALGFLGQILVTSALGDLFQPRLPGWGLSEKFAVLVRWFWALLIGLVVGGAPTLIYWINCGEVDWLDRIVLLDLMVPGLAYAQMALLSTLIHESPLAANPWTVVAAIWRVGWPYAAISVRTGTVLLMIGILFEGVMRIKDPLGQAVAFWAFWVILLYTSMVVFRWLGLFCHQHAVVLDWFPTRF